MVGLLGLALAGTTALIPVGLRTVMSPGVVMLTGLGIFGILFALNSSVHSYLVLAYSDSDKVSLSVGFYYMANAAGRLVGTLLSGFLYQQFGIVGSLWGSAILAVTAGLCAFGLPLIPSGAVQWADGAGDD
jgi:predicted MFS family arabinose efflux permease